MAIPMMGYILALIFPTYVNIYKKDTMDLHRNTAINVTVQVDKELVLEEGVSGKLLPRMWRRSKKGPTTSDVAGSRGHQGRVGYSNYICYGW